MRQSIKNFLKSKLDFREAWENQVSLNSFDDLPLETLEEVKKYLPDSIEWDFWASGEDRYKLTESELVQVIEKDSNPLPPIADREGYFGENHFKYWISGLREMNTLIEYSRKYGVEVENYLDFGCATGRVVRHFACQQPVKRVCGVDINRRHIEWINRYLPAKIKAAQTTSIPSLPFADNCFDLITAFSVFTHIEAFETAWLLEIQRILRPGGIAWITVHTENTWASVEPDWPLYGPLANHPKFQPYLQNRKEMPQDRLVFRYSQGRSYTSNVFYKTDYIKQVWSRFFDVLEILPRVPDYQDVAVLRKRG